MAEPANPLSSIFYALAAVPAKIGDTVSLHVLVVLRTSYRQDIRMMKKRADDPLMYVMHLIEDRDL